MAKRFPRDQRRATEDILNDCTRVTLAQSAIYSYPRGGTDVTGPSIRLAEVIFQRWGNMQAGLRELERKPGSSVMQAFCWDLETNAREELVFEVPHIRVSRTGRQDLTDPRDIYETIANQGARRRRACILAMIPGDVVEMAVEACEKTQATKVDIKADVPALIKSFEEFKVTLPMLEAHLGRSMDAVRPAQVIRLRSIYRSLKEGMSDVNTWFHAPKEEKAEENPFPLNTAEKVNQQLGKEKK